MNFCQKIHFLFEVTKMMDLSSLIAQNLTTILNFLICKALIETGNRLVDTAVQGLLLGFANFAVNYIITFFTKDGYQIMLRKCNLSEKRGTDFLSTSVEAPKEFRFKIFVSNSDELEIFSKWFLKYCSDKLNKGTIFLGTSVTHYMEYRRIDNKSSEDQDETSQEQSCMLTYEYIPKAIVDFTPIWLSKKGEYVFVNRQINKSSKEEQEDEGNISLFFCSNSQEAMEELFQDIFIKSKTIKTESENQLHFYRTVFHGGSDGVVGVEKFGNLNRIKTFNCLFFKQKDMLLEVLNKFIKGKMYPVGSGMENRLGILLHGPPGTGKTAVVQAIGNYTNRSVILVNMRTILTTKAFDIVMKRDAKKHIFVFEEFDCVIDIIASRKIEPVNPDNLISSNSRGNNSISIMNEMDRRNANKLTLDYILTTLDGYASTEGRIIIATTNHPEKIDQALKRPGRFGTELNLSYCDRNMIASIVGLHKCVKSETLIDCIPEGICDVWTPTEVMEFCCIIPGAAEEVIGQLIKNKPFNR